AGNKLAAAGQENNVFQKAQRAGFAAVLVVNVAVHVTGVGKLDEFGAGIKVAVIPAGQAKAGGNTVGHFQLFVEIEQHELAGEERKAELAQRIVVRAAEGHELGFNAG